MTHVWDPICARPRGLVRPVRIDPAGLRGPTRGAAQGPRWRRVAQGWYVPLGAPDVPEQRILEQSVRLPPGGAVTGWASLRLQRANFFDGLAADRRELLPVPLAVGRRSKVRGNDQVVLSREELRPDEVTVCAGVPCTVVQRAVFDEMRRVRDLREAVVVMDMAAAALLVSIRRMATYLAARTRWRRSALVAEALGFASEWSRSPNETRTRLIYVRDVGLPPPRVNQPLWDLGGNLLGIADLFDPAAGLVGEFDGADHRRASRHTRDIEREERFKRHDLEVFRVTGLDLRHPARVAERIRFHRSRALWLPAERRRWTTEPPLGWEVEPTLDEYLDEQDFLQEQYRQGA